MDFLDWLERNDTLIATIGAVAASIAALVSVYGARAARLSLRKQLSIESFDTYTDSANVIIGNHDGVKRVPRIDFVQGRDSPRWLIEQLTVRKSRRRFLPDWITRRWPILLPKVKWIYSLGQRYCGEHQSSPYSVPHWLYEIKYDLPVSSDRILFSPEINNSIVLKFRVFLRTDHRIRNNVYLYVPVENEPTDRESPS